MNKKRIIILISLFVILMIFFLYRAGYALSLNKILLEYAQLEDPIILDKYDSKYFNRGIIVVKGKENKQEIYYMFHYQHLFNLLYKIDKSASISSDNLKTKAPFYRCYPL